LISTEAFYVQMWQIIHITYALRRDTINTWGGHTSWFKLAGFYFGTLKIASTVVQPWCYIMVSWRWECEKSFSSSATATCCQRLEKFFFF